MSWLKIQYPEKTEEVLVLCSRLIQYDQRRPICCYNPEVFCHLLDNTLALSKCSSAGSSTVSITRDPDCVIIEFNEVVGTFSDEFYASAGAAHADKPKGVTAELLEKCEELMNPLQEGSLKLPLSSTGMM